MKRKRFTEEQILAVLKEVAAGVPVVEVCRRHGVGESTLYRWKAKYGDLDVPEIRRLRTLEAENSQLKRLVADQALDLQALKVALSKKY